MPYDVTSLRQLDAYRVAVLEEAEAICRETLGHGPIGASTLHLYGLLAAKHNQAHIAIALLSQAVARAPSRLQYVVDLGDALSRAGRLDAATDVYLRAIAMAANKGALYLPLSRILVRRGRLQEALVVCDEAIRLVPDNAVGYLERGRVRQMLGSLSNALEDYRRSTAIAPTDWRAHHRIGELHLERREWRSATASFRAGLERASNVPELHIGIGVASLRLGLLVDAVDAFNAALSITPRDVEAARQLVMTLELLGNQYEAVGAWCSLGAALAMGERFEEAVMAYEAALSRKPDCLRALVRLGHLYLGTARPNDGIACYERALAIRSDHARVHRGRGWAWLSLGEFARGWDEAARDRSELDRKQRDFEQPTWDGTSAPNDTILVWADQGLGDTIQFLRYVPLVKACCQRVLVECNHALVPLVSCAEGVDRVIVRHAPLPTFDQQVTFHGLGRIFETRGLTLSDHVPYLRVDPSLVERWRERLSPGCEKTVGLVWAGDPSRKDGRSRFLRLSEFGRLAGLSGLRIVSLQLGAPTIELAALPHELCIEEFLTPSCSIADTAALVLNLDLVVTIDTMMAHLAGALGQRVWTLLPYAAEWRWEVSGEASRWYPTMRLFRQTQRGDWTGVVNRVREALQESITTRA